MRKGFTAEETLAGMVILAVVAVFISSFIFIKGTFDRYRKAEEKMLGTEAKVMLTRIWLREKAHRARQGSYISLQDLNVLYRKSYPQVCDPNYYFKYSVDLLQNKNFRAVATRCTEGGKEPQGLAAYEIILDGKGNISSSIPDFVKTAVKKMK